MKKRSKTMKMRWYMAILLLLGLSVGLSGCIDFEVTVPDVIGLPMQEAQELVNSKNLVDVLVEGIPAEESELEYIVYAQDPQAGTRVIRGTSVLMTHYGEKLEPEPNPYAWVRGLLTLKPLPSAQKTSDPVIDYNPTAKQASDLGFNLIVPYASTPSGWTGAIITRSMRPGNVIARFTNDEPDCRKHDPGKELERYWAMKRETPNIPIGTVLCCDIGCGWDPPGYTKEEWQEEWLRVANQMDFIILSTYPYREPQYIGGRTPVEEMELFHKRWNETVTVPIIVCIQAHNTYYDQIRPNPMEQVKFWVGRGYGYIVYPWNNAMTDKPNSIRGVIDAQEEWRAANEWAASQN